MFQSSVSDQYLYVLCGPKKYYLLQESKWCGRADLVHALGSCDFSTGAVAESLRECKAKVVSRQVFVPGQPRVFKDGDSTYLNSWIDPAVSPVHGDYSELSSSLLRVSGGPRKCLFLQRWWAERVKPPYVKPGCALVFTTQEGSSFDQRILIEAMRHTMGPENCDTFKSRDLSRANSKWALKSMVFASVPKLDTTSTTTTRFVSSLFFHVKWPSVRINGHETDHKTAFVLFSHKTSALINNSHYVAPFKSLKTTGEALTEASRLLSADGTLSEEGKRQASALLSNLKAMKPNEGWPIRWNTK